MNLSNNSNRGQGVGEKSKCNHRNIWIVAGGALLWCYVCGAIRPNAGGSHKRKIYWQPISKDGKNPAMVYPKWYPARTWNND